MPSNNGGGDDPCEHYDAQVGIQITEIEVTDEQEIERYCDWCGGLPDILLIKSQNDGLVFCEECRNIIRILARPSRVAPDNLPDKQTE